MKRGFLAVAAALACLACGSYEGTGTPADPPRDADALADALQRTGATVAIGGQVQQPFFAVAGRILVVNGADVQVFQFADEAAARSTGASVSADGSAIGTTMVSWVAPPHFYRTGPLVALYVGSDATVTAALQAVMGPQFAGR